MADTGTEGKGGWAAVAAWLWSNKDWILKRWQDLKDWFGRGEVTKGSPGILILGSGGAGKTTFARLMSDADYNFFAYLSGEYQESIGIEQYSLKDDPEVRIVVPPGQRHRREATWAELHSDLAAGHYRGIVFLTSYGHNNFMLSYKNHRLYENNKERFVERYLKEQQDEEVEILKSLAPHLTVSPDRLWMLSLVVKQDLWWPQQGEVERHYREGPYWNEVEAMIAKKGAREFRHEIVFASLVISNFTTGTGEQLRPNATGYDMKQQVGSLRRVIETLDALREWEAGS